MHMTLLQLELVWVPACRQAEKAVLNQVEQPVALI